MNTKLNDREKAIEPGNQKGYYVVDLYGKCLINTLSDAIAYKKEHGGSLWTFEEWDKKETGW